MNWDRLEEAIVTASYLLIMYCITGIILATIFGVLIEVGVLK